MDHFVYMLKCNDGSYYTGYTNNVVARLKKHQDGKGAKYTRGRAPLQIVYTKGFETKEEAMKAEYAIKQLTKQQKKQLILEERLNRNENTTELSE